jgi:hypothetical protein
MSFDRTLRRSIATEIRGGFSEIFGVPALITRPHAVCYNNRVKKILTNIN